MFFWCQYPFAVSMTPYAKTDIESKQGLTVGSVIRSLTSIEETAQMHVQYVFILFKNKSEKIMDKFCPKNYLISCKLLCFCLKQW